MADEIENQAPETAGAEGAPETAAAEPQLDAAARRKLRGRHVPAGIAHITATFNNTMVAITDPRGGCVSWCSSGRAGFKGSRKSTAFAATVVAQDAARQAIGRGMHEVEVRVQGAGAGRESAVRGLQSAGLNISIIKDVTPIPHNGCRSRKRRRV
jgi:small subunit ribosomal protein S11